jgi:transcriptional regulator with XRE-family HTH domain
VSKPHLKELAEIIKGKRQELGLNQLEFSKLIKVNRPQVSNIENGRSDMSASKLLFVMKLKRKDFRIELKTPPAKG